MSVNWSWKEKRGEITFNQRGKEFKAGIYEGNCRLIALHEFKEVDEDGKEHDMYNMYLFFADDDHAKRCLGLTKRRDGNQENLYKEITKIRISREHGHFKKIVKWFMDAYPDITIEIYSEKEVESNDGRDRL